jgi:hypothetical protein
MTGVVMFKRRWKWFGELVSDEGFSLAYGNRTITYKDERGSFKFGFEDGFLFPQPNQTSGKRKSLNQTELNEMIERIIGGIKSEGREIQVYSKQDPEDPRRSERRPPCVGPAF